HAARGRAHGEEDQGDYELDGRQDTGRCGGLRRRPRRGRGGLGSDLPSPSSRCAVPGVQGPSCPSRAEKSRETYHSACGTGWSTPLVSARNHGPPSAPGTSSSWVAWAVSASSLAAYAESSSSTLWVSRESGTA